MRRSLLAVLAALLALLVSTTAPAASPLFGAGPLAFSEALSGEGKVVGVYLPSWEPVEQLTRIQPGSVTHLVYAFLHICGPGQLAADQAACAGKADFQLTDGDLERRYDTALQQLKSTRMPGLKVVVSIGGWGGSDPFFHLAGKPAARASFVGAAQRFLREHPGFDGIDIDWEHPGNNGAANGVQLGSTSDGQDYALLMQDLRGALDALGRETDRHYLLTVAVNTTQEVVQRINFRAAAPSLDLVFMMTYDFYGGWSKVSGNHTTLQPSGPDADDSLERSVRNLDRAGVPRAKMVAGVAMYGRGFAGVSSPQTGAAKGADWPADEDGALPYREIASRYLDRSGRGRAGFQAVYDAETEAWSLFDAKRKIFIGYDDPRAVLAKSRFATEQGLAGVFAWELSQDNGDILNAMNEGLGKSPQRKR